MPLPEIGLSTAALYPGTLTEDALDAVAEMGFPVAEVFLQSLEEYSAAFGRRLDRRRRASGVRVHSLHLHTAYFEMGSLYARTQQEARARFLDALEIATRLGARGLTWHGARYGFGNPALMAGFFESVAWAAAEAHAAGITLCIENVSWCYLRRVEHVEALLRLDAPLGFTFDTFQAGESDSEPTALIRAMGSRLLTVHLADYAPDGPRHLPLGEGQLDWGPTLDALRAVGYAGPLIIELAGVHQRETFEASRRFILRQLAETQKVAAPA